jgi:predicted nucleotidyltransferase
MTESVLALAEKIAQRFSLLPDVEAVVVGGSQATGAAGQASDIDIYVFPHSEIPVEVRTAITAEFSDQVEVIDFWGPGNEWDDRETGIHIDCMFFTVSFIEDQIDRVLRRYEPWLGYSTAFWHTVRVARILFDRHGWFDRLQKKALQEYPETLVQAIIAHNYPALRQIHPSYRRQLEKAAARDDTVSLNHRMAGLLASYFDIIFAVNRMPHPGEKRQLDFAEQFCQKLPANFRENVNRALHATVQHDEPVTQAVDRLIDALDDLLAREGLLEIAKGRVIPAKSTQT